MWSFLVRRVLQTVIVLWAVATMVFLIVRLAPGDPFASQKGLSEQVRKARKERWGLDQPMYVQYGRYLLNLSTGDFGQSMRRKTFSVTDIMARAFPISASLGLLALTMALFFGTLIGSLAAAGRNTLQDYVAMSISVVGICLPTFITGPLLILVFSYYLDLLPSAGWPMHAGQLDQLILPSITLALPYTAYIARLTRTSMLDTLGKNYVRTARAKGVRPLRVHYHHALSNSMIPVISYLGPAFAYILTGSVVVEKIFRLPGIGKQFINAAINRDYNLVQGIAILFCFLVVLFNSLTDIGYYLLDPRVRSGGSGPS